MTAGRDREGRTKPLIYLAGPYTNPDPVDNTHRAIKVATAICDADWWYAPLVPHLTMLWHAVTPRPIDFWYELDLAHLVACKRIVRLPGASTGADREMEFARQNGIWEVAFENLPKEAQEAWLG